MSSTTSVGEPPAEDRGHRSARARAAQAERAERFRAASDARAAERELDLWFASMHAQNLDASLVASTRARLLRYDGFTRPLLAAAGRPVSPAQTDVCPPALSAEDVEAAGHLVATTEVTPVFAAWADMTVPQVERELGNALTLQGSMPRMLRTAWDGEAYEQHLDTVLRATTGLDDGQIARLDEFAAGLPDRGLKSFQRQVRAFAARLRQETEPDIAKTIAEQRSVSVKACPDGSATLWVNGPAPEIYALYTRLNSCARHLRRDSTGNSADGVDGASGAGGAGADITDDDAAVGPARGGQIRDPRTLAQLRFDLLISALVDGRNPDHLPAQARVAVTVPLLTAIGVADLPGELDGFGPLDAESARDIAARVPTWNRILTDPTTGQILPASGQYRIPAALRDHVRQRNRWCTVPGCTKRPTDCETDHIIPFDFSSNEGDGPPGSGDPPARDNRDDITPLRGGRTEHENLQNLCVAHHQAKTEGRLTIRRTIDDTGVPVLRWTLPGLGQHFDVADDIDTANAEQVRILVAHQQSHAALATAGDADAPPF